MNVIPTRIPGVVIVEPKVFGDTRGFFLETFHKQRYAEAGIGEDFVQDNLSRSKQGVLRGLHVQSPGFQGKLVSVLEGEVFDVAVDIRRGSPTFGAWVGLNISAGNKKQFYVPPGLAHGFVVLSEYALFSYKCTAFYQPANEISLAWDDPDIGIEWPIKTPILSDKDKQALSLKNLPQDRLLPFNLG